MDNNTKNFLKFAPVALWVGATIVALCAAFNSGNIFYVTCGLISFAGIVVAGIKKFIEENK